MPCYLCTFGSTETYSYVLQHPYTITAVNAVSQVDIMAPLHDVHVSARDNIFNMSETMTGHINTVLEKYSALVQTGRDVSLSLVNEAASHPYVQVALTQVQNTATKVGYCYPYSRNMTTLPEIIIFSFVIWR